MIRKFEILANVAIIVTAVVLCSVLAKKYFLKDNEVVAAKMAQSRSSATASGRSGLLPGTKISLPAINSASSHQTLILALSTSCHYCTESAPFYQRLQQEKPRDLHLVAVFPQPVEQSRAYLDKLGVNISEVVQSRLAAVGVSGTPTLILIDERGSVQDSWVGKLSEAETSKVISQLNGGVAEQQR